MCRDFHHTAPDDYGNVSRWVGNHESEPPSEFRCTYTIVITVSTVSERCVGSYAFTVMFSFPHVWSVLSFILPKSNHTTVPVDWSCKIKSRLTSVHSLVFFFFNSWKRTWELTSHLHYVMPNHLTKLHFFSILKKIWTVATGALKLIYWHYALTPLS